MIRKKQTPEHLVIDLTGPGGNAYALMSYATDLANMLSIESAPIISEMMAGDYEQLVNTFEKHFGKFVILKR